MRYGSCQRRRVWKIHSKMINIVLYIVWTRKWSTSISKSSYTDYSALSWCFYLNAEQGRSDSREIFKRIIKIFNAVRDQLLAQMLVTKNVSFEKRLPLLETGETPEVTVLLRKTNSTIGSLIVNEPLHLPITLYMKLLMIKDASISRRSNVRCRFL